MIKFNKNGQWSLEKRCWDGYEPTPGKKAYEKGSCRPETKKGEMFDIEVGGSEDSKNTETYEKEFEKEKKLKKGIDAIEDQFSNIGFQTKIDGNGNKLQPSDKELFGHLVVSEEELQKREDHWNNTFNRHLSGINKPIDELNKNDKLDFNWEDGKSFNDYLSEKEVDKRNKSIS